MDEFIINITSFPTAFYSTALVVVIGYWLLAIIGTFDIDFFDVEADLDLDGDMGDVGKIAGLLSTLGLTGVPLRIVLSLLILNGWVFCYFISLFIPDLPSFVALVQFAIGVVVLLVSFGISILASAAMTRPLKKLFVKLNQQPKSKRLIGATCKIRSSRADTSFGEAECVSQGASLIIKVRTTDEKTFNKGDMAVLVEHNAENDFFYIISESEFNRAIS